jgi:hypothetical protein
MCNVISSNALFAFSLLALAYLVLQSQMHLWEGDILASWHASLAHQP